MTELAGSSTNLRVHLTDTMDSKHNQARCIPDFPYPLVASISLPSSSSIPRPYPQLYDHRRTHSEVIPLYLYMSWSLVNLKYCLHQVLYTVHTADNGYSIPWVQHTPCAVYTMFSMHHVQHTLSPAYTQYSVYPVQHTPSIAYTRYCILQGQHSPRTVYAKDRIRPIHHPPEMDCLTASLPSFLWLQVHPWMSLQFQAYLHIDQLLTASYSWELKDQVNWLHFQSCMLTNWWID